MLVFSSHLVFVCGGGNLVQQQAHVMLNNQRFNVCCRKKALGDHMLILLQKRIEKPTRVQQSDRLIMDSKLPLAQKLREFFKSSETPRTRHNSENRMARDEQKFEQIDHCEKTYASLASNILAFRSDIVSVASVWPTISPESSAGIKNFGIQPLTLPPFDRTWRAIWMAWSQNRVGFTVGGYTLPSPLAQQFHLRK
jgi:hypothetical protein